MIPLELIGKNMPLEASGFLCGITNETKEGTPGLNGIGSSHFLAAFVNIVLMG